MHRQNLYKEAQFVYLWKLEAEVWNIPFLAFRIFFCWRPFWKCPRRVSASQNFPVNITDSYSMCCKLAEKYEFVDLWEGCMMGLPKSACLMVKKSCFLGLYLPKFPNQILTQITTPATQCWCKMKAQKCYFPSMSILVMEFIIKYV